ncbi:uncharacterized protein LOC122509733 [Leptopilina heterotoma]|uniref:uncharacterized protein LOC122507726 n=1 Tax=Leptopilina heterotoma TaxID=63436 RepID=UPI001CA7D243|nr:uncharacterized protein LOC122507726 [Leptopilina heterotoma]XP_043479902.1 uncharacterized protein LOC122509733 [Leptopilina heterotoma]
MNLDKLNAAIKVMETDKTSNYCKDFVKIMNNAFKTLSKKTTTEELNFWINNSVKNIRLLNKLLRNRSVSCGEKKKILSTIGLLKANSRKFKKLRRTGTGLFKKDERWIRWEELENAFENRIRTGVVINLKHKNMDSFLSDAKKMIISRLKNAFKKVGNMKVNVVLAANYTVLEEGEEIDDIKYFNTRNSKILESTNFDEWFDHKIREKLFVKIDDFQQKKSGLRSKLYAFKLWGDEEAKKKAKGVKYSTLKKIGFDDFKHTLNENENLIRSQHFIRSKKHEVFTVKQNKIALSWQDDKRILIPGKTDTFPWGYQQHEPMEIDEIDV